MSFLFFFIKILLIVLAFKSGVSIIGYLFDCCICWTCICFMIGCCPCQFIVVGILLHICVFDVLKNVHLPPFFLVIIKLAPSNMGKLSCLLKNTISCFFHTTILLYCVFLSNSLMFMEGIYPVQKSSLLFSVS